MKRHRRLRVILAVVTAGIAALFIAATLFVLSQRHVTTPVTKADALRRFRAARAHEAPADQPSGAGGLEAPPSTAAATGAAVSAPTRRASASGVNPAGARSANVAGGPGPYTLPAEGVYAYHASGGDTISVAGASHTYPSTVYDTITHQGGCLWRSEFDIAKENESTRTLCSEPGRLSLLEDKRQITYFGQTETEDPKCHPPFVFHDLTEAVGASTNGVCDSSDSHIEVKATYLGHDPVTVDGVALDAVHLRCVGTVRGRANGTADEQLWVVPQTGLVLRWDRTEDANGNGFFNVNVHYHEKATFVLESLTPST
jgi:hypothetical protein